MITNKMLDARHIGVSDKCILHVHEGTVRSSKTVTAIEEFMDHLHKSEHELHLIACADLDSIRDNILESTFGLLKLYPEAELVKDKIGGYFVRVKSYVKDESVYRRKYKKILLAGYSNIDKWKKILGKTIDTILVDEVNIASKQFIDECFARQASVDHPLTIWTLNGDAPTHWIYKDYINHCTIIGTVPASIKADMDKVPKTLGYYYQHWTMVDNPAMTAEKIARVSSIYPVGSYYHTIKVKGERGAPGKLIYLDYLKESLLIDGQSKFFTRFTIGVDIAETRASNAYILVGWNEDYTKCCVMDKDVFKGVGYKDKQQRLFAFVQKHLKAKRYIECIAIDSAEQNFIYDMQGFFSPYNVKVVGSNKATIKERIDMNIVALSTGRLLFDLSCKDIYDAFLIAKWVDGYEGEKREDKNEQHNDIIDATEYAQTVHMHAFMKAKYREVTTE